MSKFDYAGWPAWAIGKCDGLLVVGASLPTRDGRVCGNAVLVDYITHVYHAGGIYEEGVYVVATDMGNLMNLNEAEVRQLFYDPVWVCSESDIWKRINTWRE